MLLFPNAKINIGLNILRRRPDGYHDICTVMVPVGWRDVLEMVPAKGAETTFTLVGDDTLHLSDARDNLVMKALAALEKHIGHKLPPTDIYLSKIVPTGAGLGGGSADAAFAIRGANKLWNLGLSNEEMAAVAAKVGADCPFFIYNRPMLAEGIGEVLTPLDVPALDGLTVLIVKPSAEAVSTRDAYAGVTPHIPEGTYIMADAIAASPEQWMESGVLYNDFETSIFPLRPTIAQTKQKLAATNPLYVSMSGSGASVFALYPNDKLAEEAAKAFTGHEIYVGRLSSDEISER